ncbi:hypothetical protein PROFUN_12948 [Planoprotostelium fungivorum]|uniref:Uncharacterized protein n=1 Tax=Planoprotostelium fungivorum TaxID=1890364 RepID=A0A2P6N5Y2_9EUKA|nr:hypothetical protein PROFUN_12948 [Planoprotostelium fungivorum]
MSSRERPLDEEQESKYQELIDLLLVGGYFRARIAGLSRFDKIVGGMAWCITSSNEDLDVDLFFEEEANLKQRIKLGEDIIKALNRMKCPFRLESHQIQGGANSSDFVKIFPVVQWLVKRVIETREETGDLMRQFSESQFGKNFALPEEADIQDHKEEAGRFLSGVTDRYRHNRKFKNKQGKRRAYLNSRNREESIQMALLEFGDFYKVSKPKAAQKSNAIAATLEQQMGGKKKEGMSAEEEEESRNEALKQQMTQFDSSGRVNTNILGDLLPDNIEELENMYQNTDEYSEESQRLFGAKLHQQNVHKLQRDIAAQQEEGQRLRQHVDETTRKFEETQAEYSQKHEYNQRITSEIEKLDALETPENTKQLQMLKGLVALNENLKVQGEQFKANCKRQRDEVMQKIADLREQLSEERKNSEEAEIEAVFNQDVERLQQLRSLLAKKTRAVVMIERKVDEVPSRIELGQYQRMFVELYDQIALKLVETRQYYNTYNTCDDTKTYLSKEVSILNSVHDNYKTVQNNRNGKEQLLTQLTGITTSVATTLGKSEQKLNAERENRSKIGDAYAAVLEQERLYYKAVKEFQTECKKNEELLSKLQDGA